MTEPEWLDPSDPDFDEMIALPAWHERMQCPGTLTHDEESGWQCSLDELCPMMQEVLRLHAENQ